MKSTTRLMRRVALIAATAAILVMAVLTLARVDDEGEDDVGWSGEPNGPVDERGHLRPTGLPPLCIP